MEAQVEDLKAVCKLTSGDRQKLLLVASSDTSAEGRITDAATLAAMGIHVPPAVSLPQSVAGISTSSTIINVIATPSEPGVWAKPPATAVTTSNNTSRVDTV